MTLWLIIGLMTAAAIFAVIWPLARHGVAVRSGSDIAVYRDQLDELERDLAAGFIGETEAEAARVEISRRLLAAADATLAPPSDPNAVAAVRRRRSIALVALLLVPAGTGALYLRLGSPGLASGLMTVQRDTQQDQQASIENLVAKAEVHLQKNSEDGRGWEVLAPVYMKLGRYSDSAFAWHNAIQLLGENADRQANLGEALMAEANGIVTANAKAAFTRAVALDKTIVSARYYLGMAADQDGKPEEAARIWRALIAEAPTGAHWASDVRSALARVEGKPGAPSPGPSAAQMAAAAKQPAERQNAMIRGMVDGLAARLKKDGSDPDGWVRLVRSYKVLGERDKAQAAIRDARQALANEPEKRRRLDSALQDPDGGGGVLATTPPPQQANPPSMPPQHEGDAIRGMVDRLSERLKRSGSDPDGWIMLARSYFALGEKDKVASTIKDARAALANDEAKLRFFNNAIGRAKIGEGAGAAPAAPAVADVRPPAGADGQNNEMIRGMVARLANRLKQDGSDFDGWMRLVRSYLVLGERDKAMSAATDARRAIGSDTDKRRRFDDYVKSLGLNS